MFIPLSFPNTEQRGEEPSCNLSPLEAALDHYRWGSFDAAHAIVQDDGSAEAAYIHGMLHRREGDYENARYWFRRAQGSAVYRHLIVTIKSFEPIGFVNRCERAKTDRERREAEELQYLEWLTLSLFIKDRSSPDGKD